MIQNTKRGNTRFETIVRWLGLEELIVNDVTEIPNVLKAGIVPKYKNINLLLNDKIAECKEMLHEVLTLNPKRNAALTVMIFCQTKIFNMKIYQSKLWK